MTSDITAERAGPAPIPVTSKPRISRKRLIMTGALIAAGLSRAAPTDASLASAPPMHAISVLIPAATCRQFVVI